MHKLIAVVLLLALAGCAEKPDGIIVMNEETIENFLERDGPKQSWNPGVHLNLLTNQPVVQADLPPVPENMARLYGVMTSDGKYEFKGGGQKERGSSFSESVFGMLGPAGKDGNAWFYADFDPATGEIMDARAYVYGFMGGVCDMRKKNGASFGSVGQRNFTLIMDGPCLFPQISGATMEYSLFATGSTAGLKQGGSGTARYVMDETGKIASFPANPRADNAVYDVGTAKIWMNEGH